MSKVFTTNAITHQDTPVDLTDEDVVIPTNEEPADLDAQDESSTNAYQSIQSDGNLVFTAPVNPLADTPPVIEEPEEDTPPTTDTTETEEATPVEQEETAPESTGDANSDEYEGYSDAALMALHFEQNGWIEQDDTNKITKELDYNGFEQMLSARFQKELAKAREQAIASVGQTAEYVEHLLSGGSAQTVSQAGALDQLIGLDLEDENNQELIVKAAHRAKDLEDDAIEAIIGKLKDKDALKDKAENIQEQYKTHRENLLANERKAQEQQIANQKKAQEQQEQNIRKIISSGKIDSIELNATEQQDLLTALFEPTEIITYQDANGKTQRTKVTKVQAREYELNKDLNAQLKYAYWLIYGSDSNKIAQKAIDKDRTKILDRLNAQTTKKAQPKSSGSKKNAWLDL